MTDRVYNFSPGPAVLPVPVLEQAQRDLLALPGAGASILEVSHRSKAFEGILADAKSRLKALLGIPDNYQILFLQGGARLQFSMIPMNLLRGASAGADYVVTGSWSKNALDEAKKEGPVTRGLGRQGDELRPSAVDGCRCSSIPTPPTCTSPRTKPSRACSSRRIRTRAMCRWCATLRRDFLHRPVDVKQYGILYACAQKNAGPAGVTDRDHPRRPAETRPGFAAGLPELPHARREQLAVEHAAGVRRSTFSA